MSIVITGATGSFGRLAIEALLRRGLPPGQLVAAGRNVTKLADLQERGVTVVRGDYDDPPSLRKAFAGADRSCSCPGARSGSASPSIRRSSMRRPARA